MTQRTSETRVLVIKGSRTGHVFLAWERRSGLLLHEGFRDSAVAIRAKARISHPKMGDTSRLLASRGRGCVSSTTSLDTLEGIARRGRDLRVIGHHSPSHQWDMHRRSLFLPTPPWAREDNISHRVLHKHLLFRRQAIGARAWVKVEVKDKAHRQGLRGPKAVSKQLHQKVRRQINRLFRVCLCYLAYG